ncbi:MAG: DNA primase, partial [Lamprocystis purpurea]|nr:DNA primase [Lamprocystis purpurea]
TLADLEAQARMAPSTGARRSRPRRGVTPVQRPTRPSLVAQAIALLLDHPELAPAAAEQADDWRRLENPGVAVLAQLLDAITAYPGINKATLTERWRDHPHFDYLQRLSVEPFLRDVPEDGLAAELIGALQGLSKDVRDAERLQPLNRRSTAEWSEEIREQMDRDHAQARTRLR